MRVLVATDAWHPQVNGVVLGHVSREARAFGFELEFLSPDQFRTLPMPSYPEIRLALAASRQVARRLEESRPDAIHVATEGPLGHAMRRVCLRGGLPFTTSFHTRFSDYLAERLPVPERWTSEVMGLVAPVSCIGRRDACRNAVACFRAHHARLQKRRAVAPRCRCRTLPAARAGQFEFSSPDFSDGRPACGGKKP